MFERIAVAGRAAAVALWLAGSAQGASLVFSEIMYHPVGDPTNAAVSDEYEFIELYNAGPTNVVLSGAQFTAGISYTFTNGAFLAPGGYAVVAHNRAFFTNRYPAAASLADGIYTGTLNNAGEKVTLKTAGGTTIYSATYGAGGAWPEWADGEGASLVLANPDGDPDSATNWCASAQFNGTPGATGLCASTDIVINEVLTHTDPPQEDAIELYNNSAAPISVKGWYLSDSPEQRKKYRITNDTIAARGFLVFYEYQFQTNALFDTNNIAFELSSDLGDRVYLTAADAASNLTRIVDLQSFGAAENGSPFGLYPNGTGVFVTLNALTLGTTNPPTLAAFRAGPGATNAGPRVGPVVISEIMYHPANDSADEEYIELFNVSTNAVPLYLGTNGWKLTSAVDYVFPTNFVLGPTQRVVVAGATNWAVFRSVYGISTNVPLCGPWSGQLNNAGESIRLYRPDIPNLDGFVPYLLVDRVDYGDAAPWPTAPDGNGPSLERTVNTNLGNAADNWFTGAPGGSPGEAATGGFVSPALAPAVPLSGQGMTVTVSVVAQLLPTQVIVRTEINGVFSNRVMRDDGVAPDAVAGDRSYTAAFVAPTNAWMHYLFLAYAGGAEAFRLPARETVYRPAPTLSIGDCSKGVFGTVLPTTEWKTFVFSNIVRSANCFFLYLNAAGDALLDDVTMADAGGTNHIANGTFATSLASWNVHTGYNHSASFREVLADEGSNAVMHVKAWGAGNVGDFNNTISQFVSPSMATGTSARLSFRTRQTSYMVDHWFAVLAGSAPAEAVINEIMYHPAQTNEASYEYVELFNTAAVPVDLSDWMLNGVNDYHFPTGLVLGAGGFLVVCADATNISAAYGLTNVVGGWAGELSNKGEKLRLYNAYGRVVDEVVYDDRSPWPASADGEGPSLERLNSYAPGGTSLNWAASSAATNWQQMTWTGAVSAVNQGLRIFLDYAGMCWLDEVSVVPVGGSTNLVANGGFEAGLTNWTAAGGHARSRVYAGQGRGGSNALALFSNEGRYIFPDSVGGLDIRLGDFTNSHVRTAGLATTNGGSYVVTCWVRREGVGGQVLAVLDGVTNAVDLGLRGSPGRTNSVATTNAVPGVLAVSQAANVVPVGGTNIIRASVSPPGLVGSVQLRYRVVGTNTYFFTDRSYSNLVMADNGIAPDLVAGDGEYAAYGPAVTSKWKLVRYHVLATATNGLTARWPQADDPERDLAYWVQGAPPQTNIPNWFVLVDGNPVMYPYDTKCCAVAPDGKAYVDIIIRHRGHAPSDTNTAMRTGISLRMNNANLFDAWFASNQEGINFRSRKNDYASDSARIVAEYLAYSLQRQLGMPAPRIRHVCLWINDDPSVSVELESPQEEFLTDQGLSLSDYVSRSSYTKFRPIVAGDPLLDNFDEVLDTLRAASNAAKYLVVLTNVCLESAQRGIAFANTIGDGDQHFAWNNFQHRRASDGRWTQFPWDIDVSFDLSVDYAVNQTTNLHPYYQTQLHPSIWATNAMEPLGQVLFYPETGPGSEYTLPYRYRQQMAMWRDCHTWFTTNTLHPMLAELQTRLLPVYSNILPAGAVGFFTNRIAETKTFIASRRDFLLNQGWSDKMAGLWAATNVYAPTNVVINEIMAAPLAGGEYVELYNPGGQVLDLGGWHLRAGAESYRLPYGTMLAPTSYLVFADTELSLTNYFTELGAASNMVERYPGYRVWDWPNVFTTATEFASRVVELDAMTLPSTGTTVQVLDAFSNVIDSVSFGTAPPWPTNAGWSIEVINPLADNNAVTNWRLSAVVGTPGWRNSAAADQDADGLDDAWELRVVAASGGAITSVTGVLADADFDNDGLPNGDEFELGLDPTVADRALAALDIRGTNGGVRVAWGTLPATGAPYQVYSGRFYDLQRSTNLLDAAGWSVVPGYLDRPGDGQPVSYTNLAPAAGERFRFEAELRPLRP